MFVGNESREKLEKKIEKAMRQSYSEGDYVRCYNLMKLMAKVNKDNKLLLVYLNRLDENKVEKIKNKWALGGSFVLNLFKSPKLYFAFFMLVLLGRIK